MCGICGYISLKEINSDILNKMNDSMIHRGPNDHGIHQFRFGKYNIGFAQRRLAILDLSELGHQPMFSISGKSLITYNGEVYNYKNLQKELMKNSVKFRSKCDTEVILELYEKYGMECIKHLNGMFAFAIYDFQKNQVIISRDRFGKKPLYYFYDENSKDFVFASTLQPIMMFPGFQKKINTDSLYQYFYYGYICEPNSIFQNVYKLEPGSTLRLKLNDFSIEKKGYWNVYDTFYKNSFNLIENYAEAKERLRKTLVEAVRERMVADVPIGTFLSGGIDSTLVTAIAQSITGKKINTYSIGFHEKEYDESVYAEDISKYIGTNHHRFMVSENDMFQLINDLPRYYDEPFSDSSQLPTMIVSKLASQDITVALTGDGGDELFCGYAGYDNILKMQKYKWIAKLIGSIGKSCFIQQKAPSRFLSVINAADDNGCQWISVALKKLLDGLFLSVHDRVKYDESYLDEGINIQMRRMLLDLSTYLPGDILHKVDRASMKYSLEARCPILDFNVAELSFRIPHKYKYMKGEKKYILKELTYEFVPKQLLDRPKKGFSVPLRRILRTDRIHKELEMYTDKKFIEQQGLFDLDFVLKIRNMVDFDNSKYEQSYVNNAVNIMWNYLVFQKWYGLYLGI